MKISIKVVIYLLFLSTYSTLFLWADHPRAPLPDDVFDGGAVSAETMGRGNTTASALSSMSAGSENPAALYSPFKDSFYSTVYLKSSSSLPKQTTRPLDPLQGKALQYLSVGAQKGVIFYEPLSRYEAFQTLNTAAPNTDFRSIDFEANAVGFAGGDRLKNGEVGISLAYVWSSLTVTDRQAGLPTVVKTDSADGLRMNIGFRYPVGPTMWGIIFQNMPGLLWGSHYRAFHMPMKIKIGTTYRLAPGVLFSIEGEQRYYNEGSDTVDYVFVGQEVQASKFITLRVGAFGEKIDVAAKRHLTAGISLRIPDKVTLSYALESLELLDERVKRSYISAQFPFQAPSGE